MRLSEKSEKFKRGILMLMQGIILVIAEALYIEKFGIEAFAEGILKMLEGIVVGMVVVLPWVMLAVGAIAIVEELRVQDPAGERVFAAQ